MDAKKIILKLIDEQGLMSFVKDDLFDGVVLAKLQELAKKTDNSLDDALVAMIYPIMKDSVVKVLEAELEKLKA